MKCELCERFVECVMVEVSTYDRDEHAWHRRSCLMVCGKCVEIAKEIVSASVKSWTKSPTQSKVKK